MMLKQQWQYLNLTRNSFCILFLAKGIMSYRQIISSHLYVHLKGTCSVAGQALSTPVSKLNNVNVNYLKIPKKHCGLHKMLSQVTCGHVFEIHTKKQLIHTKKQLNS